MQALRDLSCSAGKRKDINVFVNTYVVLDLCLLFNGLLNDVIGLVLSLGLYAK